MNRPWWIVGLAVVALAAGVLSHRLSPMPNPVSSTRTGSLDATFADLEGKLHPLREWQGKVLVVNFWATWCPPCLKEIPAFLELQRKYGAQGLQFVGIALDSREEVAAFVRDRAVNYPVMAGEEEVARYMREMGNELGALPFTLVFDRNGVLRHSQQGEWQAADAEAALVPLLGQK